MFFLLYLSTSNSGLDIGYDASGRALVLPDKEDR